MRAPLPARRHWWRTTSPARRRSAALRSRCGSVRSASRQPRAPHTCSGGVCGPSGTTGRGAEHWHASLNSACRGIVRGDPPGSGAHAGSLLHHSGALPPKTQGTSIFRCRSTAGPATIFAAASLKYKFPTHSAIKLSAGPVLPGRGCDGARGCHQVRHRKHQRPRLHSAPHVQCNQCRLDVELVSLGLT